MANKKLVFMFSGQGSQYYGMAKDLYRNNAIFRQWMIRLDEVVRQSTGRSVVSVIYDDNRRVSEEFSSTRDTHPALFVVQYSLYRTLISSGVYPDFLLGSSLGEYVAAAAGEMLGYEEMLRIVMRQADILERTCVKGRMLAVLDNPEHAQEQTAFSKLGELAAVNTENNFVVSGGVEELNSLSDRFRESDIASVRLPTIHAFHSSLIDAAKDEFMSCLGEHNLANPTVPCISTVYENRDSNHAYIKEYLWDAVREKMEFGRALDRFDPHKEYDYVDLGPTGTLSNFLIHNGHPKSSCVPVITPFVDCAAKLGSVVNILKGRRGNSQCASNVVWHSESPMRNRTEAVRVKCMEGRLKMKAYIFPGQGSQIKGMGKDIFNKYSEYVKKADEILGYSIEELCLSNPEGKLHKTQYTQPALYTVNAITYLNLSDSSDSPPDYLAGHSLGEYAALFASGALSFEDGLRAVVKRGELMSNAPLGTMLAVVGVDEERLKSVMRDGELSTIDIANYNSPKQYVLSGLVNDIERASKLFQARQIMCIPLNVSAAFHSRYMRGIRDEFEKYLSGVHFSEVAIPVISNVTARPYSKENIKASLVDQITGSVKWTESIRYLIAKGVTQYQEVGPGDVLTKLVNKIKEETTSLDGLGSESCDVEERIEVNSRSSIPINRSSVVKRDGSAGILSKSRDDRANIVHHIDRRKNLNISPEQLGSNKFKKDYDLKYPYIAGAMYRGISSSQMVIKMAKAGMMGILGTGGVPLSSVEESIDAIQRELTENQSYGVNFLNSVNGSNLESDTVDLFLRKGVKHIEAAAFMQNLSIPLVYYRIKGISENAQGGVEASNKIIAKVSRPEVAEAFLSPPPPKYINALRESGKISMEEAELAARIPMADDLCVEADSGGHTDQGVAYALMPAMITLRDRMKAKWGYENEIRIGAAGGIGTPEAAAAAFMLGADFIVTGSINQCTVEANTSELVKDLLQAMNVQDTDYAPAGDMFELGAKVQVLKRGLFFPARANKLHELYRMYDSLDQINPAVRDKLQQKYFGRTFESIYDDVKKYFSKVHPMEIEKAESNPKHKMALVFRWYFFYTTNLALEGKADKKVDFQIHTGPALGAFNQWVKGTELEDWRNRHVDAVGLKLIDETARFLGRRFDLMMH